MNRKEYERILNYAIEGMPNEVCGLIGGVVDGEVKMIKAVYLLNNLDQSSVHFSMDPVEQLAAVKDSRKKGYLLLGNFHSHPETPSRPSAEDKRLAYDSRASYLILSLQNQAAPVLKSFRISGETVCEEPIVFFE